MMSAGISARPDVRSTSRARSRRALNRLREDDNQRDGEAGEQHPVLTADDIHLDSIEL